MTMLLMIIKTMMITYHKGPLPLREGYQEQPSVIEQIPNPNSHFLQFWNTSSDYQSLENLSTTVTSSQTFFKYPTPAVETK